MKATMRFCCAGRYVVAAILIVPASASAQDMAVAVPPPSVAPSPPSPASASMPMTAAPAPGRDPIPQAQDSELGQPRPQRTRLRFEAGLDSSFTIVGSIGNFGFGSYVRLGGQFKPWVHAQAELSAGTLFISWYVRGALTAGFTPVRWFTASVGPVIGYSYGHGIDGSPTVDTSYAGATVRTDFHVVQRRAASGRRHSLTLGLTGDLGGSFGSNGNNPGVAVGAMFHIGYTMH